MPYRLVLLGVLSVCPFAAPASPLGPAGAGVHTADLVGRLPTGEALVHIHRRTGEEELWAWALPSGPATRLALRADAAPLVPPAHTPLAAQPPDTPVGELRLSLEVQPALGDRGRAELRAHDTDGGSVSLERLPPPGPRPTLAALWALDRWVVVAVDRPGGRRSLHVVDRARTRARLAHQAGQRAWAAGDVRRAIAQWQAAQAADPTYGDAAYDLACAYARAGAPALARQLLEVAVGIDAPRYRRLARLDPDLATVATTTRSVDPAPSPR